MFNKSLGLGLLAASFMLAPTVAFANGQKIEQETVQRATAIGPGSRVTQSSREFSSQRQTRTGARCPGDKQFQRSRQRNFQDGLAVDGGIVRQRDELISRQRQNIHRKRCY